MTVTANFPPLTHLAFDATDAVAKDVAWRLQHYLER